MENDLSYLVSQEKIMRESGDEVECLKVSVKIIDIFLQNVSKKKSNLSKLLSFTKDLFKKKEQTLYTVLGIIKYVISPANTILNLEEKDLFFDLFPTFLKKKTEFREIEEIRKRIQIKDYNSVHVLINKLNLNNYRKKEEEKKPKTPTKNSSKKTLLNNEEVPASSFTEEDVSSDRNSDKRETGGSSGSTRGSMGEMIEERTNQTPKNKFFIDKKLPFVTCTCSDTFSSDQIEEIIKKIPKKMGYHFTHKEKKIGANGIFEVDYVFEKKNSSVLNRFCCRYDEKIFIGIIHNKNPIDQYERIVDMKCIKGKKSHLEQDLLLITAEIFLQIRNSKIVKVSSKFSFDFYLKLKKKLRGTNYYENLEKEANKSSLQNLSQKVTEEDSSIIEKSNVSASNYYQIYKILSDEKYGLGKSLADFIVSFKESKSEVLDTKKENCPFSFDKNETVINPAEQMKKIIKEINKCISCYHSYYNVGNKNQINDISSDAIEKFVFNKLYYALFNSYESKYKEENEKFLQAQQEIKGKYTVDEIMSQLSIKEKFRASYRPTINGINKIEFEQTPKEKLDTLMKASLEMRNTILGLTKGKTELESMDDELPLFIYFGTQITVSNIVAELHLIEDYLNFSTNVEKENKVLTNLFSAVFYITNNQIGVN